MTEPIARSNHGPIPHHESWGGTGPTLEETKRAQRPNLKAAGEAVVEHAVDEARDHVIEHGAFKVVGNILGEVANGAPEAVQFRDTMKRCVSEGVAVAHAKNLRTPEALAELREHDPAFRERWESDAGFQVGVRAAIWQAQVHPDEFEATNRVRAELQMSLRTTRYA